ncbi:hypothetical protein CKC_04680 [Candidatus Liberibacter solanacearum CLso-ZC1]|uniref:Tyrosine specific protein phosphatases domain-containing protein n=1 Tax=Liberibacter solanacearum (strain CLso-ZC1) TaxID=658172 RepID=E4UDK7_LIBSC|nr:dual specificity protein phosphatase family protein [Candidatus Liberibacter solanacearum]ADR52685.1 hypothetical protein CKC_04680 [Candidatus Liberibacter solanacearum CLso-ZC1]
MNYTKKLKQNIFLSFKISLLGLFVIFPIVLGLFCFILTSYTQNFHVIVPNELYRSAQPTGQFIETIWEKHGIKSILNLRGENNEPWYREEEMTIRNLGIQLINFPIPASKELNNAEIKKLIDILRKAPKPLLIHCKAGADRTGLASALYLYSISHYPKYKASGQLSIFYGHIPLFGARSMDITFEKYTKEFSNDLYIENAKHFLNLA